MGGIWYAVPTFGRDCQRRPSPAQRSVIPACSPPAEYRQLCAIAGIRFAVDGRAGRCRCPQVEMSLGTPHAPGVPTCL